MSKEKIEIKETSNQDLENTLALWNDGDVMKFVGIPEGLGETMAGMNQWFKWIEKGRPKRNHYSSYSEILGYCGETFYHIDHEKMNAASLDLK